MDGRDQKNRGNFAETGKGAGNVVSLNTKSPPSSLEAERAVLAALVNDESVIPVAIERLHPHDFYREAHRIIFEQVQLLFEKGSPVDLLTLGDALESRGYLDRVGGRAYLAETATSFTTAANFDAHVSILLEKSTLRQLLGASSEVLALGHREDLPAAEALDEAERLIFSIAQRRIQRGFIPISELLQQSFKKIEELYERQEHLTGVASGFNDLDRLTSGFQPSDLIILAGRPAMGKSSLALNMAAHAGVELKVPAAIFSLEMSIEQVVMKLLCSEARVDLQLLRSGRLREQDWPKLTIAAGRLAESEIYIDDTPGINILEMRAKCRRLAAEKGGVGLVVVDYLQLMQGSRRIDNRVQEISEISRSLKLLARELNCPVIALSQLSRGVEHRQDHRPQLADLRESGSIEQDADLVIFVYRDEYYNETEENAGIAEVLIRKQRHGPVGDLKLAFIREYTRFENLSTRPVEQPVEEDFAV